MKLVVFGASGQTGHLLVNQALQLGHEVIAYARRENSVEEVHDKLSLIIGELNEPVKIESALSGAIPDIKGRCGCVDP